MLSKFSIKTVFKNEKTNMILNIKFYMKIIKIFLGTFLKKIYKVKKFYIYLTSLLYNSSTQEELI